MVAATPVCNAIFSGILNASGYDQSADVALNTLGQSAAVNTAISVSYIWVETAAYALCAVLVFLWTVEKNLPAEQAAIAEETSLQALLVREKVEAARRAMLLYPQQLSWNWWDDVTVELRFWLPAGSFATSVVRELINTTGDYANIAE